MVLQCIGCNQKYDPNEALYKCRKCGDLLEVCYDYDLIAERLRPSLWRRLQLSVWKYKDLLPIIDKTKIVSLNEGGTGLLSCRRLARELGLKILYVKNEGENPTGSFKDRGMTVGVSRALELNVKTVFCASTGNTSASLAAYAARAGLRCVVLVPSGKIAYGKLVQAMACGAEIVQMKGNFDQALSLAIALSERHREFYLLNSINPYRLEGQKTLAFEVCDQLEDRAPDVVVLPVGNAGNISALWKGFKEFQMLGIINDLPRMIGVQAEGASPIARAVKEGRDTISPVEKPETVATAIRIGSPVSWKKALRAIKESRGTAEIVTDREILEAQKLLAEKEGIFVEPASASSIAGLKKIIESGAIDKDESVVCVATGHGLKDPDIIMKISPKPLEVNADEEKILDLLKVQG
ncbi:TPA: threonine synthase [Candidatus Bathyarchaeota archaeon]|nr:threonine synthase [Candidatus Bathyarchaeota archaeon]